MRVIKLVLKGLAFSLRSVLHTNNSDQQEELVPLTLKVIVTIGLGCRYTAYLHVKPFLNFKNIIGPV